MQGATATPGVLHPGAQPDHPDNEYGGDGQYHDLGTLAGKIMDLQLQDKLAVVTGSTAGIGYAIAEALAREGARVVINGRTAPAVDAAIAKIAAAGYSALGFPGDLGTAQSATALAHAFPDVDILVNNLGIFEQKAFEEIPDEDWRRLFEVNVLAGVRLVRAFLPGMKRRNWGRIIFYLQRERDPDSGRDDSLRRDQDPRSSRWSPGAWRSRSQARASQ
jgi:hypothetical protein